jgi:hypothetical protein
MGEMNAAIMATRKAVAKNLNENGLAFSMARILPSCIDTFVSPCAEGFISQPEGPIEGCEPPFARVKSLRDEKTLAT